MTIDLEGELRRRGWPSGRYAAPQPGPYHKPDTFAPLAAALAAALRETPDPKHAAAAALHLIDCFPNARVGKAAYSQGLADIVADEDVPPAVVRHVCRRVRAEAKTLPPLAELRAQMLAELRARQDLLANLEFFPRWLADEHKRDMEEAERIATAAARHGAALDPGDIVAIRHNTTETWLYERVKLPAMRAGESPEDSDVLMAVLEIARPPEAFEAAITLLPDLIAYCREWAAADATAPPRGTPEDNAWNRMWPVPEKRFADRLAPIIEAFKRAHKL